MIHRITEFPAHFGHWIILLYFYTELLDKNKKFIIQNLVILLSLLINFYFTLMLLMIFFLNQFYNLIFQQKSFKSILNQCFLVLIPIVSAMYVFGYFQISPDDGLGWGYGYYNLNLNSLFNPLGETHTEINWSNFFCKPLQNGEMMVFLSWFQVYFLLLFFKHFFFEKKIYMSQHVFVISFIFFSINSNNITLAILQFYYPLNKYLYAIASF